jgi:uncharacterized protein (TIGR03437 family)
VSIPVALTIQPTASPAVSITSVLNAASFLPGFAPNGWVTITGAGLSQTSRAWQAADIVDGQLPTSLDGVSVTIGGTPAYVSYVSPTQLNVLAPAVAVQGVNTLPSVNVEVLAPGGKADFSAQMSQVAPAVFGLGSSRYAAAIHSDGTLVAPVGLFPGLTSRPAQPSETISVFLAGLGTNTSPPVPSGSVVTASAAIFDPVTATIGGTHSTVVYAGLVATGEYQVNLVVPSVGSGDQPLIVGLDGVSSQAGVVISVQAQ